MHRRASQTSAAVASAVACLLVAGCSSDPDAHASTTTVTVDKKPTPTAAEVPVDADLQQALTQQVESWGLDGAAYIVVDRDRGVVFEDYVGTFDESRVSLIASSSKMLTAGVLSRLEDQGLIDLEQPIVEYVDWAEGTNPGVTAGHLISNTSGIAGFHRNYQEPDIGALTANGFGHLPVTDEAYDCARDPAITLTDCASQVMNHRFNAIGSSGDPAHSTMMAGAAPGTLFRYGGSPWQVAGAVAESVSGKPWNQLIHETYVEPCGTDSIGYGNHWINTDGSSYPANIDPAAQPPTANPQMEGGAFSTAADYADILLMHLRGGRCEGGQVLSPEAVEKAHTNRTAHTGSDYGLGWWTTPLPDGSSRSFINGMYGSNSFIDLGKGYGAHLVIEGNYKAGVDIGNELMAYVDQAYEDGSGIG